MEAADALQDGDILLLENVRFHPGEEKRSGSPRGWWHWRTYMSMTLGAAHRLRV